MKYQLYKALPEPWVPRNYAKRAVKFLLQNASAALFLDPGLGKTSITLAALKLLLKKKQIGKVLVIAPLRVCHLVWPKECQKWKDFNGLRTIVLHGPEKDELLKTEADVYVINPEGLDWLIKPEKITTISKTTGKKKVQLKVDIKRWKSLGFDTLVIDELSKFKHRDSLRFRTLKLIHHLFGRRWGLTGSPAANGLMDLFGQAYILDEGRTFGPYITHFQRAYFEKGYDGFSWNLRPGSEQKIYERIKPLALRMAAEDYLEMPDLIENNIYVQLPSGARKVYDEMERYLLTQIDDKTVTAANAAVAIGKLRQIANGGIYHGQELLDIVQGNQQTKRTWTNLHDIKCDALEDLIEELQGSPLLVAYDFQHDLDRLKKRFGDKIPVIGGGTSMKETVRIEKSWNAGELSLVFAHMQAMAHGLNLQEVAQHVCCYAMNWNYELYDQFVRRVFRQGNKHSRVFVHHILSEDTVDDMVLLPMIKMKRSDQNALFDALKKMRRV